MYDTTYLVPVDYSKTAEELIAAGGMATQDCRLRGKSKNGEGIIQRVFGIKFYHDLPTPVAQLAKDFRHQKVREADTVELITFCLKHPEVPRIFIVVGMGDSRTCHVTECHTIYPAIFSKGGLLFASEVKTDDSDELSDSYGYLVVYE